MKSLVADGLSVLHCAGLCMLAAGTLSLWGCSNSQSPEPSASPSAADQRDEQPSAQVTEPANPARAGLSEGLAQVVPADLVDANGHAVNRDQLADKVIGLYFSAHWCPPCKQFTPKLVQFRNRHANAFEVVFVSSDRNEQAQLDYMSEYGMKWPAVKFGPAIRQLGAKYSVRGIPTLIILSPDGEVITHQGRSDVTQRPSKALEGWQAKAGLS